MIAAAAASDKQIAMALLLPGWEKTFYGQPKIDPVVCIGTIAAHEKLADGNYNLLLQGTRRARISKEIQHHPYRIAELESLNDSAVMEIDVINERRRLISVFSNGQFKDVPVCRKFLEMLAGPMPTGEIVDQIAFNLLEDIALKQKLLAETDQRRRAGRVVSALETLQCWC